MFTFFGKLRTICQFGIPTVDDSSGQLDSDVYMRLNDVLKEKGFHEASMQIDRYDAHFIRTGNVHPMVLQGDRAFRKTSEKLVSH